MVGSDRKTPMHKKNNPDEFGSKNREHVIRKYAWLVKFAAGRLAMRVPSTVLFDELVSAGCMGLIEAVDKFDPNRDIDFKTYALHRIRGAMLDDLRKRDRYSRPMRRKIQAIEKAVQTVEAREGRPAEDFEVAQQLGVDLEHYYKTLSEIDSRALFSLDEYLRGGTNDADNRASFKDSIRSSDNPDRHLALQELKRVLADAVGKLSEKEQRVISLYYYDELTLKEIGCVMDLTESRICQIHAVVLIKLKSRLKAYQQGE